MRKNKENFRNKLKKKSSTKNLYYRTQGGRKHDSSKKDSGRTPKSE